MTSEYENMYDYNEIYMGSINTVVSYFLYN